MEFYIALTVVVFAIGAWNVGIAVLGCFPRFRATAVGTLTRVNSRRNVRDRHGNRIPVITRYVYTYQVNGRQYKYSGEELRSKRHLLPRAAMVYVKWFPRRAYPNRFQGTTEWVTGILMLFMGMLMVFTLTAS